MPMQVYVPIREKKGREIEMTRKLIREKANGNFIIIKIEIGIKTHITVSLEDCFFLLFLLLFLNENLTFS